LSACHAAHGCIRSHCVDTTPVGEGGGREQTGWLCKRADESGPALCMCVCVCVCVPMCLQVVYVSSVFAGGQSCFALSDQNIMGFISSLHELCAAERKFYCHLSAIRSKILRPLLARGGYCSHGRVTGQGSNIRGQSSRAAGA